MVLKPFGKDTGQHKCLLVAAGGTAGHLFPAQALAAEMARRGWRIALVTDRRAQRFTSEFPADEIHTLPSATFSGRGVTGRIAALFRILSGTVRALRLAGRIRPAAVIGFGGYPTLPPLLAALLLRLPVCVHEQNAVPGRVNRLVGRWAAAVAATFDTAAITAVPGRFVVTGNPVRAAVRDRAGQPWPNRDDGTLRLLVFGGSQGARVFSDVVPAALAAMSAQAREKVSVVQQCRHEDVRRVGDLYAAMNVPVVIAEFFDDMPEQMSQAHLVIARAGASTVSELTVIGRPSILVPLPHALDADQSANAGFLSRAGGAWVLPQDQFTPSALAARLEELMNDPARLAAAALHAAGQGHPDAVRRLADLMETLAHGNTRRAAAPDVPGDSSNSHHKNVSMAALGFWGIQQGVAS